MIVIAVWKALVVGIGVGFFLCSLYPLNWKHGLFMLIAMVALATIVLPSLVVT